MIHDRGMKQLNRTSKRSTPILFKLAIVMSTMGLTAINASANDLELNVAELAQIQADANLNSDPRPSLCNLGTRDTLEICANTNKVRHRFKRGSVRSDAKLNRLAMEYARQLYKYNGGRGLKLSHNIPGYEFRKRMARGKVTPPYGENIAAGYRDPAATVEGWKNSQGHFRNMVDSDYTKVGAAHYEGFWVQIFSR